MLDLLKKISILPAALLMLAACRKEEPDIPIPEPSDFPVFNLENRTVRSYLDRLELQPYTDGDYSYSWIDEYWDMTTSYRKDHPAPATVEWTANPESIAQSVTVSENADFSDSWSWPVKNSASSYDIFNLIPGRTYYWKAEARMEDDTMILLDSAHFHTEGRRRFLRIDNICNVRDLGGIPTMNGKHIRYGLLFRGGEMNGYNLDKSGEYCRASYYGLRDLRQAGIRADLDMRTEKESTGIEESPLGADADYILFPEANQYYYDKFWTTDDYIKAVRWIIDELKLGRPVYFHCIYGADRTGTLAFIIEALLGVSENQMSVDYEMTSFSYGLNDAPRRRGPKNEVSVYRYRQMLEGVLSSKFDGETVQEKIRNFLIHGCTDKKRSATVSEEDLDWFADRVLEN